MAMRRVQAPFWRGTVSVAALAAGLAVAPLGAQDQSPRASLNFNGVTGLIDMPSGESQADAALTTTVSHFAGITRTSLSFQITPKLSGTFRYASTDGLFPTRWDTYFDRSFDLRYQFLDETPMLPAMAVGLQDFIGTGIYSSEYLVATKHLTPDLKVTGGLGWGRLGSYGSFASVGTRPAIDFGRGGNANTAQWFRGPVAAFGGVEWQVTPEVGLKAEYSSDDYTLETRDGVFNRKSPFNFGVEYTPNPAFRLGAYYMYGSEVGFTAQITLDPKTRALPVSAGAPIPVKPRPSRSSDPDAWSPEWITQADAPDLLRKNMQKQLDADGIEVVALAVTSERAQLRIRNHRFDSTAQAVGRTARVMTQFLPASVEVFEIVPMVNGMAVSKVTLRRSDIEALENAPNGAEALRARAVISAAGPEPARLSFNEELYPRFSWGIAPYMRMSIFDPDAPVRADIGLRASASYDLAPGLVLSGAVTKRVVGNLEGSGRVSNSTLPHVRSDTNIYDRQGDPAIERLQLAWYTNLGENTYGRVTAGYLERMFGGVSGEVLWKPVDSPLAVGAELNYVRQRDFGQGLGFQNYDVLTGHLSAYYNFGNGFHGQVDAGRYLAGDWGATLTLDREFDNGWKVGAFATLTNVSAEEFGEGSFDKGIRIEIPVTWATGKPSRTKQSTVLRPLTRDGGARLEVDGRLYETVRDYQESGLDTQWGRVWQ
ncbi:MAG: YjbH domain-containing protein [Paracoccaceae bacterium]